MKQLLLVGSARVALVMMEAERTGAFEVVGMVTETGDAPIAGRQAFSREQALQRFERRSTVAFACGDQRFLNQQRLADFLWLKAAGFATTAIASRQASVAPDVNLRENVLVEAGAVVQSAASIRANSVIGPGAVIGAGAKVGSSCWLGSGCIVGDGATIGNNCLVGEGVVIAPGVALPAWSCINRRVTIDTTPQRALYLDPLFRAEVYFHQAPRTDA